MEPSYRLDAVVAFSLSSLTGRSPCSTGRDDFHRRSHVFVGVWWSQGWRRRVTQSEIHASDVRMYVGACDARAGLATTYPDESHASRSRVSPKSIGRSAELQSRSTYFPLSGACLRLIYTMSNVCVRLCGNWAPFSRTVPFTRARPDESRNDRDPPPSRTRRVAW